MMLNSTVLSDIKTIIHTSRDKAIRAVDTERVLMYWRRQFYRSFPIAHTLCAQLSWSHYKHLLGIDNQNSREFYIAETVKSNWSVRQLERQINSI